jgi:pyrroloquinoline quinone biosynthesis protein D
VLVTADSRPALPRGVRLHHDAVRGVWVLLAPERVLRLDEIGLAILREVDGRATLAEIAARLAARYGAPEGRVMADAATFLDGLAARRMLDA